MWGQAFWPAAALSGGVAFIRDFYPRCATYSGMRTYERRLPHWDTVGQALFVTFRLLGSLPASRVFPPERLRNGRAFAGMDKLLDCNRAGPLFLSRPEVANLIVRALWDGERFGRYRLHAFVVMPNHVHLLVTPQVTARQWLGPLKGFTGHVANRLVGRSGAFWQDESYDHLVRDSQSFERIRHYIEWNPVKAGLAGSPEEFAWSSATPPERAAAAQKGLTPQVACKS